MLKPNMYVIATNELEFFQVTSAIHNWGASSLLENRKLFTLGRISRFIDLKCQFPIVEHEIENKIIEAAYHESEIKVLSIHSFPQTLKALASLRFTHNSYEEWLLHKAFKDEVDKYKKDLADVGDLVAWIELKKDKS